MIVQREIMPNANGQFFRAKRSSLPEIRIAGKMNEEETVDE
jgi:hypothetical protein